ncbi:MAG: leucine-rich repeat domain-containing protein, partial [Polyangiaceae bacterium]
MTVGESPGSFWSFSVENGSVTTTCGSLGSPGKAQSKPFANAEAANEFAAKKLAEKVTEGYVWDGLRFETARWKDVKSELKVAGNSESPDDRVLVLSSDVLVPHTLWIDYRQGLMRCSEGENPVAGILVRGNLTIEGALLNWEDDYGPFLQVEGTLTTRTMATGGSQIYVGGDLVTEELVGAYNHGAVKVGGNLTARVIATEHLVEAKGAVNAHRYDGWASKVYEIRNGIIDEANPFEGSGVFASALVGNGSVDLQLARTWVSKGKPIAKAAFTSVRDEFVKRMGTKLPAPEKVKRLALTAKDLRMLPDELFAFRNLEKLDLTQNKLRTLPERIGELTELRELHLRGNGLLRLPESIGNLEKLEHLTLEANCIVDLPASLAKCTKLKTVILTNNPYSYVCTAFGGWQKVELMWKLPDALFDLPVLETLTFDSTFVRSLPGKPFASSHLKTIAADHTLLQDVDAAVYPQFKLKPGDAKKRAVNYIGYWFDGEEIQIDSFYDGSRGTYDFREVHALVRLLVRINIPTAAPYKEALTEFEKQSKDLEDRLNWKKQSTEQLKRLFQSLLELLDVLEQDYP